MAFGRLERKSPPTPMSDINMTPLIDVILVLLVIFMIAAPLMTSSLRLELPEAGGASPFDSPPSLSVALDPQGQLYLGDEKIDSLALTERLTTAARGQPLTEVQLRADKAVPYGRVAELIATVQKAGIHRIGFVTEPASAR